MKTKLRYKGRYRVGTDQLQAWGYAGSAWYFITACTKNKEPFFGAIIEDEIQLSTLGMIVGEEWKRAERIRPNVTLDEFVIMPNHFHAIIGIRVDPPTKTISVEPHIRASLHASPIRLPRSLGSIIAGFKSAATKRIRASGRPDFAWQRSYYDHVIRSDGNLRRIRKYMRRNPLTWALDRFHPPG